MHIGDIAGRRAIYSPDALAIVDAGKSPHWQLTYAQLNTRANQLAHWLRESVGIKKGDRVGILAHNGVEFLDAFFACGKLGAVLACYNWRLHWRELVTIAENTTPKALIYSDDFAESVHHIAENTPSLTHILHIDGDGLPDSHHFETTLHNAPDSPITTDDLSEKDIACLIFTGGTTGLPKGAQVSHRMIAWNTLNTIIHDLQHDDVTVNVFPMFHTGGLLVYTTPMLILGGTVILTRQFDPTQVLDLLQHYKATVFAGVPTMYQMLTTAPTWEDADLSNLRFCTSGGAPLPVTLVEKFRDEKGVRFKQGFGMSEFGPGIFALSADDAIRKAGSIGRPNFFVDARIVDKNNHPLGANQVGELVLKGASMSSGYFNNPTASADSVDDEGWFHTGDLAKYDDEWYFYIVDRKKDMFVSGGENVYPTEIEQVLYRHDAVHMCAVVGVPHEKWGEVGQAFVVLNPEHTLSEQDLLGYLRDHLARYKVPHRIIFRESLPISGAGKILKRELT